MTISPMNSKITSASTSLDADDESQMLLSFKIRNALDGSVVETSSRNKSNSIIRSYLNHPIAIGGGCLVSMMGVLISVIFLSPLLHTISSKCFDAEMETQEDFNKCNAPYVPNLILYNSLLVISSMIMGFALQKLWERPNPIYGLERQKEPSSSLSKSLQQRVSEKFKYSIAYLQTNYSYETLLVLGYVYNGIGIKVDDRSSFHTTLVCSSAAMGIASGVLGMYARVQWIAIRDFLSRRASNQNHLIINDSVAERTNHWKNHWKTITLSGCGGATIILASTLNSYIPSTVSAIMKDLSIILLGKPIGRIVNHCTEYYRTNTNQSSFKRKIASIFSACLSLQLPLLTLGYATYLFPQSLAYKYTGLAILGFTLGIKDGRYEPIKLADREEVEQAVSRSGLKKIACKVGYLIKNYWKTAALVSFAGVLAKFRFLDCDGPPTPLNFTCPVGLETSIYAAGNQVVIESLGVNIAITAGLTHYYARRIFKTIERQTSGIPQKMARSYVEMTDKYQLDFLTIIPYALIRSGEYVESVRNFYSYNPIAPLILVGVTFATYKEQVNAQGKMHDHPS